MAATSLFANGVLRTKPTIFYFRINCLLLDGWEESISN